MNRCIECRFCYSNKRGSRLCKLDKLVVNAYGCERDLTEERR